MTTPLPVPSSLFRQAFYTMLLRENDDEFHLPPLPGIFTQVLERIDGAGTLRHPPASLAG